MKKILPILVFACMMSFQSCLEEINDEFLYTFTGETISDYLKNRPEYSTFLEVIDSAEMKGLLATRGSYTCFAPTNDAFELYFAEKNISSVADLTTEDINDIAYNHVIAEEYLTTDLAEGAMPLPNMNDRYIMISFVSLDGELAVMVNKTSKIMIKDAEVVNGVIHTLDQVLRPSNSLLPDLMTENPDISLFNQAMAMTGMCDSLRLYIDYDWEPLPYRPAATSGSIISTVRLPEKRKFGYTALVETDSIYKSKGIENIDDLIAYAKKVYDEVYPEDKGLYDSDYTHRKNPLNRFVSYHLLNRTLYYNTFYTRTIGSIAGYEVYDYYETLCPYTLLRTSDGGGVCLNRSIKKNIPGLMVEPSVGDFDQNAINGIYHYVSDILVYDLTVRDYVLNERIRVDASSMLPELMNNGFRGCQKVYAFNDEYFDWLTVSQDSRIFYQDPTSANTCYQGDEFIVEGTYDVTIKLPPVPEGMYEIRFGYFGKNTRGIAQFYVDGEPCGIPLDLSIYGENEPKIGWERPGTDVNDPEGLENDKMMRNRGYMKGPNSVRIGANGDILRYRAAALRRIVVRKYLENDEPHYVRAKSVLENDNLGFMYDYFELCPKSVYDGETGEDID